MIITRTPFRISIGGGGTDLPSYYENFGGFCISAAIDRYVYISVSKTFFPGFSLKYSEFEHANSYRDIRHPLIREALQMHEMPCNLEVVSVADVPAGTGLGSSGSFLVGLLHALHAYKHQPVTAHALAEQAINIEMTRLGAPVGKQDQTIAAYGGILCQDYHQDGSVTVSPLKLSPGGLLELRESLMLFFVGQTRASASLLQDQKQKLEGRDAGMIENLHFVKELGYEVKKVLEASNINRFGELMHEHWMRKKARSSGMSSDRIDDLYNMARDKAGATGGKLVGAGGSGFLLFHTQDRRALRELMTREGITEMNFGFDFDGSTVMLRDR